MNDYVQTFQLAMLCLIIAKQWEPETGFNWYWFCQTMLGCALLLLAAAQALAKP